MDLVRTTRKNNNWTSDGPTYGEWLRNADPGDLTRAERSSLAEERAWELENRATVAQLDAMVGLDAKLIRRMETVASDVMKCVGRCGPRSYPEGTRFRIFSRVGKYLLARTTEGGVFWLRAEWVVPVPR